MEHSAASVGVTRRWSVRTVVLLIAGLGFIVGLVVLTARPAMAGTCDINGTAVTTVASQAECDALVALYVATDGPSWDSNTGWNTPTDPCGWYGITCDAGVTELLFGRNSLTGHIPAEIGGLTNLAVLQLSYNSLSSLPSEIGGLTSLEWLDLGGNWLSSVPSEIGGLTSLESLDLYRNQLSSLPSEIGGLTSLVYLNLAVNQLSAIPSEIGNLDSLEWLSLGVNQLSSIPSGIGSLDSLVDLSLFANQLSGDITAPMSGLQDTLVALALSDGPGENSCLTTTDSGLSAWLSSLDADWDECGVAVVVVVGGPAVVSDGVLAELDALVSGSVMRVWGANRYATAAAISESTFAPGESTPVFIATGENFPDALTAGPAAGREGASMLLVRQNSVPGETVAEMVRLDPTRIVVVGGPAVVSDAVMSTLEGYTFGSVTRVWGANRYGTAAAVSASTFGPGVSTVYVATGANFPDALAGGPAGVINDGPILLVRQNSIPKETVAELARLQPIRIVVLGGTAVVSDSVVTELGSMATSGVSRYWGANRYETAVAVSEAVFPTRAGTVFIVTGANFPDAVAAGPVAGSMNAPILLVTGTTVPSATASELARLGQ
jgi:putative cell wall-binding protein